MENKIKPCVVGLGKLGLPLAAVIAEVGYETIGLDSNEELVKEIDGAKFSSAEPELMETLEKNLGKLTFTSDISKTTTANIFFLIVPTPSLEDGAFDNKFLILAIKNLLNSWRDAEETKTIVIVSTVMPGTCENILNPIISEWLQKNNSKLKVNLLYSPEFIALGSVVYNLKNPDMTLIGCRELGDTKPFLEIMQKVTNDKSLVQVLNLTESEIVKILVNCYVTMKISFANYIGEISNSLNNINPFKIAEALGRDSRIGSKYLRPGLGYAGPCFPRDNRALISFSKALSLSADLAMATDKINSRQPQKIVDRMLSEFPRAELIGIIGLTYKANTKVVEESQTIKVAEILVKNKIQIKLYDPLLKYLDLPMNLNDCLSSLEELKECDLVLIAKEFEPQILASSITFKRTLII